MLILAVGLMASNWFILVGGVVVAIMIRLVVIPAEERARIAAFGDQYREYMQRTGGLLPRIPRPG